MTRLERWWRRWRSWLAPAGVMYAAAAEARAAAYQSGFLVPRRSPLPVVSVGNLRLGGSGKTPFVGWLAAKLLECGRHPAIVSRGYRRTTPAHQLVVVSDATTGPLVSPAEGGDEPVMLAHALPGVPVIVCADRWQACCYLAHRGLADTVVLDDGFQHLRLARDCDLVLVDAALAHERVFPAGELRESLRALHRADALIATGTPEPDAVAWLSRSWPDKPVFTMSLVPRALVSWPAGATFPLERLRGQRVLAFAGIAAPDRFFASLRQMGAEIVPLAFADHARYDAARWREILELARSKSCSAIVTTAKDAVKLPPECGEALPNNVYVLDLEVVIPEQERLLQFVLHALERNRSA